MVPSLTPVAELTGHSDRAWAVAWCPNRPLLASCSGDRSVRLVSYDSSGSRFVPLTTISTGHKGTVRSLDWHPRGKKLATASFDSTISIWEEVREHGIDDGDAMVEDTEDGETEWECATTLEGHENEVKNVKWSARGDLLASCGRDKTVWVWESLASGDFECLAVLMDHTQDVKSLAWHPTEEILASASYDDTIRLYRPETDTDDWLSTHILPAPPPRQHNGHAHAHAPGEPCTSSSHAAPAPQGHGSTVWACAFSPAGDYLASCSDDCTIRIWKRDYVRDEELPDANKTFRIGPSEKERWPCVLTIRDQHDRSIFSVDWIDSDAPESQKRERGSLGWLASAGGDGRINIFEILEKFSTASDVSQLSYTLLACIEDAHGVSDVNSVSFCRYNPLEEEKWRRTRRLLASAGDDGAIRVWRLDE